MRRTRQSSNKFLLPACLDSNSNHPRSLPFLEQYSYKDLKRATDGFHRIISSHHPRWIIYEAKLPDSTIAVVKEPKDFEQGKDIIYREAQLLGCLHHRNLVALKGYSVGRRSFLVFESIGYGSLKEHLNDPLRTPLSWMTRLHIAIGVAAALEYLRLFCEPSVYQVSISSSNIMLDEKLSAKLSDISLLDSAVYPVESVPTSFAKGSSNEEPGKLIPQFGSLILELITGQSTEESTDVMQWIREAHFRKSMDKMIDPDLGNSYDPKVMRSLLALARVCVKADANKPSFSISHILRYLQREVGLRSV